MLAVNSLKASLLDKQTEKKSCLFVKSCSFIVTFDRKIERLGSSLISLHFVRKPLRMPTSYSRNVASFLILKEL